MIHFHFSIYEYEGIRMSYVRKWVYKIHRDILYYRRLTQGRFEQDDLQRIHLNPSQLSYIQQLLSGEKFLHSTTFHGTPKEEGIQHRIMLKIEDAESKIEQLFTGEEFDLAAAQPQIEALWRRLHQWTSITAPEETAISTSHFSYPNSTLDLKWTQGRTGSLQTQHFTFKDGYLSIQSDKGQKKSMKLNPNQEDQILSYLKLAGNGLWKSVEPPKRTRSLFDQYLIFEMKAEFEEQLHQFEGEGFHFNLIENLSFLQLEFLIQLLHNMMSGEELLAPHISPQQAL